MVGIEKRWRDSATRRKFFLDVAAYKSLDPLEPKNWYSLTHDAIIKFKVSQGLQNIVVQLIKAKASVPTCSIKERPL
jgi:hypothetical protein